MRRIVLYKGKRKKNQRKRGEFIQDCERLWMLRTAIALEGINNSQEESVVGSNLPLVVLNPWLIARVVRIAARYIRQ